MLLVIAVTQWAQPAGTHVESDPGARVLLQVPAGTGTLLLQMSVEFNRDFIRA